MSKLELGGAERELRYDLNSIALIGEKLDIKIRLSHISEDLLETPIPLKALRTLIWAGLVWDIPDLTEEMVGSWVTQDNLADVVQHFFGLFNQTSPDLRARVASRLEDVADVPMTPTPSS